MATLGSKPRKRKRITKRTPLKDESPRIFRVTKKHTGGFMKGLTTTETTQVAGFKKGMVVKRAIGGGSYIVTNVKPL